MMNRIRERLASRSRSPHRDEPEDLSAGHNWCSYPSSGLNSLSNSNRNSTMSSTSTTRGGGSSTTTTVQVVEQNLNESHVTQNYQSSVIARPMASSNVTSTALTGSTVTNLLTKTASGGSTTSSSTISKTSLSDIVTSNSTSSSSSSSETIPKQHELAFLNGRWLSDHRGPLTLTDGHVVYEDTPLEDQKDNRMRILTKGDGDVIALSLSLASTINKTSGTTSTSGSTVTNSSTSVPAVPILGKTLEFRANGLYRNPLCLKPTTEISWVSVDDQTGRSPNVWRFCGKLDGKGRGVITTEELLKDVETLLKKDFLAKIGKLVEEECVEKIRGSLIKKLNGGGVELGGSSSNLATCGLKDVVPHCKICMVNPIGIAMLGCGHLLCVECGKHQCKEGKQCFFCKVPYAGKQPIFFS